MRFVSLAVFSQIDDMFSHHFAHHIGIAWSSKPIAWCLNPLPRTFEGIAEKIYGHGVERGVRRKGSEVLSHDVLSVQAGVLLVSQPPTPD
jgi:hypothetical protein